MIVNAMMTGICFGGISWCCLDNHMSTSTQHPSHANGEIYACKIAATDEGVQYFSRGR